ncbi:hypothetical protein DFH27DRAFT_599885 [Peziza echinospora]|nr:hypothetical protein DFH27DRAFT_599885 [Peziza echinospora]
MARAGQGNSGSMGEIPSNAETESQHKPKFAFRPEAASFCPAPRETIWLSSEFRSSRNRQMVWKSISIDVCDSCTTEQEQKDSHRQNVFNEYCILKTLENASDTATSKAE